MAKFYLAGKTAFATIPERTQLSLFLQKHNLLPIAAQRGVERRVGASWAPVPIYYVPKPEDTLRIRLVAENTTNVQLKSLVQEIVHAAAASKSSRRVPKSGHK